LDLNNLIAQDRYKYLRMTRMVLLYLVLHSFAVISQSGENFYWHQGQIFLDDQQIERGQIRFDYGSKMVMLRQEGRIRTFTTVGIEYFVFYDQELRLNRTFSVIEYEFRPGYRRKEFFELLIDGPLTIVRDGIPRPYEQVDYGYYVLDNTELLSIRRFKSKIWKKMYTNQPEIKKIANENDANLKERRVQFVLIDIYNSMVDPNYELKMDDDDVTKRFLESL